MERTFDAGVGYFLWSGLLGLSLAFLYDIMRVTRRIRRTPDVIVNIEDVLYFVSAGALLLLAAFDKNGGQLRWQGFLGTFLGAWLYYIVFKDRMVNTAVVCYEVMVTILMKVIKILISPVMIVYRILAKPFTVVCWHTGREISRIKGIMNTRAEKRKMRRKCRLAQRRNRRKINEKKGIRQS